MASIRSLNNKHQVRWRDPPWAGGQEHGRSFTNRKDAVAHLAIVQGFEERGEQFTDARQAPPPRIDDAMIAFLAAAPRAKAVITIVRYKTATALFGDFLADEDMEDATVDALSLDLLGAFYDWLSETGDRSLDTMHRYVENIRRAWAWLYDTEWHPLVPRPKKLEMARDQPEEVRAPTFIEAAACVRSCVSEGPRRLATVLFYTGLRTSQAERLCWERIDLEAGTMNVAPHKGLPGRIIPLSPHFVAELKTWRAELPEELAAGARVTGWVVADQTTRTRLREAWERAGVREALWSGSPGRAFRRALTSGLKQLGADKETAELYVGRSVEGARKRYLDLGSVPFEPIARLIPSIEEATATTANVLDLRRKA